MEDLKKKMDHFNIINTKILFSPKGKKKKNCKDNPQIRKDISNLHNHVY